MDVPQIEDIRTHDSAHHLKRGADLARHAQGSPGLHAIPTRSGSPETGPIRRQRQTVAGDVGSPLEPVVGEANFWLRGLPQLAGAASSRTSPTADLGRPVMSRSSKPIARPYERVCADLVAKLFITGDFSSWPLCIAIHNGHKRKLAHSCFRAGRAPAENIHILLGCDPSTP